MNKLLNIIAALCFSITFSLSAFGSTISTTQPIASDGYLAQYNCRVTAAGTCPVSLPIDPTFQNIGGKSRFLENLSLLYLGPDTTSFASAEFSYGTLLPVLKAFAVSRGSPLLPGNSDPKYTGQTGYIADANIWAVERFRYTGSVPRTIKLSASAQTSIGSSISSSRNVIGHSRMSIAAFTGADYRFDEDGVCAFGTFNGCTSHTTPLANLAAYLDPAVSWNVFEIFIDVTPGQEFYVGGFLDANVCCNAYVDSSHTMRMAFDDNSNLEVLEVPGLPSFEIPEPVSISLFLVGIMAIAFNKKLHATSRF